MIASVIGVDPRKLRRLRLGKGLTQIQLASRAGISADTIVRWEGGKGGNPHASVLWKVANVLDATPDQLLED